MRALPKTVHIPNSRWIRGGQKPSHLCGLTGFFALTPSNQACYCAAGHYLKACGVSRRLLKVIDELDDPTELDFDARNENEFKVTPRQLEGLGQLCQCPGWGALELAIPEPDDLGWVQDYAAARHPTWPDRFELHDTIAGVNDDRCAPITTRQRILKNLFEYFLHCTPIFTGF